VTLTWPPERTVRPIAADPPDGGLG